LIKIPRIVIAGTNSGCGKTTITTGIMAALIKKGLKVQPFKVGPDYIDPMFHSFITGKYSRNLDSWMLGEDKVSYLFAKNSIDSDISVIEGVMGIFDGFGGYTKEGSTAHVSKIIKAPVILVVNGEGTSLSLAALIKGFIEFDKEIAIKGVIINNIKTESHYKLLKEIIEDNLNIVVVGYLPKTDKYSLTSRHLGLIPSGEIEGLKGKLDLLSEDISKTIDLELLLKIADDAPQLEESPFKLSISINKENEVRPRIAVALDKAFNFYYKDNLDLLELLGAELLYFSPIEDTKLPEAIDGLYIGGGYPEVYAQELESNVSMREDLKRNIENGLPTYAECGGLMYMSDSIDDKAGNPYKMVGVIPGKSEMTASLQRFGYVELEISGGNVLTDKDCRVRAHEFHYSTTAVEEKLATCYTVMKQRKSKVVYSWKCGYEKNNLLAGYPHIHFWANPDLAKGFINSCKKYRLTANKQG
jgi:cobyrinic acid a,c-diamide synthase